MLQWNVLWLKIIYTFHGYYYKNVNIYDIIRLCVYIIAVMLKQIWEFI